MGLFSGPLLLIVYSFDAASRANPKSPSTSASFPFRRYLLTRLLVPLRVVADSHQIAYFRALSSSSYVSRLDQVTLHRIEYLINELHLDLPLTETFYACQAALLHPDNTSTGQQHTRQTPYQNLSAEDTICPGTGTWKNPETGVLVGGLLNVALWFQSLKLGLSLSSRYWQTRASTGKSVAHVGFGVLILLEIKLLLGLGAVADLLYRSARGGRDRRAHDSTIASEPGYLVKSTKYLDNYTRHPTAPCEYKLRGSIRATTPLCQGREGKRYQNEDFDASVHSAQGPLTVSDVVSILKTVGIVCCEIPAVICLFIPAFETGMSGRRCGGLGHRPLLYMSLIHIHLRITVYLFRPGPATTRLITPMTGCPSGCSSAGQRGTRPLCISIHSPHTYLDIEISFRLDPVDGTPGTVIGTTAATANAANAATAAVAHRAQEY
ncbi:uncharacterized protein BO96DRAFT_491836 [Aspergillus niger CBS 101883]|uniref:Uncharacterized protein n=3 Tax=Aspergillus niger TaxID=5061 RepID=A2QVG2_ASPNC|nr:uncharacterized protein BO96DRAFT_491836 [Aspergillus niger CBS 101883]XP_059604259.1 hypothetical protein An11g01290 [Aspergillus niger]PYH50276.1 hypothetical protein BO96DRAFT_491836 [Aspergillus niger CBS 101883]RDH15646.1 hypothetical protein M747DRAFT_318453 [Aspergillus niger ATCC 13496]CAK45866.1 hypothetical protein An11g01290 [Aspergillus niger]